ncbi:MAG: hypothetical protein OXT65_10355 [Alphaproteobacteria bacterium]|nr:hypothetical protein [Alphaproteobacteria bacterium]
MFWKKKKKKQDDDILNPYKLPEKEKPKKKKMGFFKKWGLIAAGGGALVLGGAYVYENETVGPYDTYITVKPGAAKSVFNEVCERTIEVSHAPDKPEKGKAADSTLKERVAETAGQECRREVEAYYVDTDKGRFVNEPSIMMGKTQQDADTLQKRFNEGGVFSVKTNRNKLFGKIPTGQDPNILHAYRWRDIDQ